MGESISIGNAYVEELRDHIERQLNAAVEIDC